MRNSSLVSGSQRAACSGVELPACQRAAPPRTHRQPEGGRKALPKTR